MVTLYDPDAIVVWGGLTLLAGFAAGQKNTSDLMHWLDTILVAGAPNERGNLTAARLTSIAAAIDEQLPPELRAGTSAAAP